MGTRRKVAIWYQRAKKEFVVIPPGWKHGIELVFHDQQSMMDFARASRLMLKYVERYKGE